MTQQNPAADAVPDGAVTAAEVRSDPAYHAGFFDAQDGEPLFPGASTVYEAGWRAFWQAAELLKDMGFSEQSDGTFSKRMVVER